MSNIVNPEERDPLAQQADRPRPSLAVRRTIPSGALPAIPGIPTPTDPITDVTASEVLPGGLPPGTREEVIQGLVPPAPEEAAAIEAANQSDPSIAPDWILPSANEQPGPIPGIPRLRLRPINYENPVVPSIEFEDDDAAIERIRNQAVSEGINDDIIHSNAIRERIARANFTSRDSGYAQPRTYIELSQEASALGMSAENRRNEAMRPQALDPNQGMLGVGRNVLAGRPFSRISQQVMGDHFSRIAEDGQYQTPLGRWIRTNIQNRWLQRAALGVSSLGRLDEYLQEIGGDIRQAELQLQADDPNYRTLAQRVGGEVRRFLTTPLHLYASGNDRPTTFRSTTDRAPLVEMLGRESPAFRQLMTELGPSLDSRRQLQTNPLRGEFGEFGSAGAFSAAMYLLNIPGGVLTGAIYDVAGATRDALARVNPTWARPTNSIRTTSAILGRDTGFTNTYTPDRYLSTIGNPALGWLPRRGQIALGFALDILADPDGLTTRPLRDVVEQAGRLGTRNAADGLAAALDDLVDVTDLTDLTDLTNFSFVDDLAAAFSGAPTVVRSTDTGIRSVATEAVLPTVRTVEGEPLAVTVTPTRRTARQGGNIVTVDDLLNRVERVLDRVDNTARQAQGLEMRMPDVAPIMREANDNYVTTLQSAVRETHILARGLQPEDFSSLAQGILVKMRARGVDVSQTGAISLPAPDPLMNALVAPIRMENAAPLYRSYSDILDMYRMAPTALPGTALELVRRSDQEIVDLAKMWGVLPHDATVSPFRVAQLRTTNPEFGSQWGTAVDPNVSQPIRRIVEMDGSSILDTPEVSRMVASPPSSSVQSIAPDDIQTVLGNLQRRYADEVVRYANASSPSTQNRITQRLAQIRQEGAKLIADFPEEAATFVARQQPEVQRYPNLIEPARSVASADMLMRQQSSVVDDLNKQLGIIANRVKEQQDALALMPPLERRFVDTELDTRRMSGEEPAIRSVATPTSMSNETEYPAAFKELVADDALLPSNHGIANSVGEIIEKGELSTLPQDEALDYIRNLVDKKILQAFDTQDLEVYGSEVTLDSLISYNDYVSDLRNAVEGIPAFAKYTSNHDLEVAVPNASNGGLYPARIIPRADVLDAMVQVARHNEVSFDSLSYTFKVTEVPPGARWLGGGAYGNAYLMPDGTVMKRGRIGDNEVRLQAKAAAQGIAPEPSTTPGIDVGGPREFTMQFLDGYSTYKKVIDDTPLLSATEQLAVQKQVFDTIDRLHRAGVVHNDIHMQNIMVNPETLDVKIIDFGLAEDVPTPIAGRNAMTEYEYVAGEFGKDVAYHGTHHTSWVDGDVFSLSNEYGPGLYVSSDLGTAIDYAKAYPAQDVVTNSTRIPRREQQGNVSAIVVENLSGAEHSTAYRTEITRAFTEELQARGETKILANFKAWIRKNDNPSGWWHYLRSKFTDDRTSDLANIQLGIRDRLVDQEVYVMKTEGPEGYIILDRDVIEHTSTPHYVEGAGSVAEALLYRNKVDDRLVSEIPNSTTRAIQAHNRLNVDTYLQNQAVAAVTKEQQLLLEQMDNLHRQQLSLDTEMLASRQSDTAQLVADMERKTNTIINYEVRNINDLCL